MKKLQIYKVGGSIRDKLLGIPSNDNDYVVVGSSIDEMLELGFKQVGRDFPVFLHPHTHEEYALARSEKKSGIGYKGFKFQFEKNITLEDDLKRRDLTINAIAQDNQGKLIDPFNGISDLQNKTIRHVSIAFKEDPLRVIRAARFSAQFDFKIAPETFKLMCKITKDQNELQSLPKERIILELTKALNNPNIMTFFEILNQCGALIQILPECHILLTNKNLARILKIAFNVTNSISTTSTNDKLIILHYVINLPYTSDEYLPAIEKSILSHEVKTLILMLLKLYPTLLELTGLTPKDMDAETLQQIIMVMDPIRQKTRFAYFLKLVRAISFSDSKAGEINKIMSLFHNITQLFKTINYSELFENGISNDHGQIVYNKKLEIIRKYLKQ